MRANLYNEVAEMRNYEVITSKEAEALKNNENLKWFETYTDELGRELISITASLEGEEDINRVLIIAE
jgi:hypothetical protein|uniref:Uncharacterized protein n=1 Tax=Siphoviridae sp. ctFiA6 TaxID=2823573 RepID=A0A8S5LGB6_9CAUD|nr:MAG TPA: hypothetical protein [Siphoviridae sp. ctFiA6]